MRTAMYRSAILTCLAAIGWAQPNQLQITPTVLNFNDANLGFSQQVTAIANNPGVLLEVALDGGTPNSPPPPWLSVTPRQINSPGRVTVAVTRPATGPGSYFGRVAFRQRSGAQTTELNAVLVRLELATAADPFSVSPQYLSFYNQTGNPVDAQSLYLTGANCAAVTVEPSDPWISVTPESANSGCRRLNVSLRSQGFGPGGQRGTIRVSFGRESLEIPVSVFLAGRGPALGLNPEGFQFEARAGNGNSVTRNLAVLNPGDNTLTWTAKIIDPAAGAPWLSLGTLEGTAAQSADGRIPITVNPGSLAVGQYSALIEVSAPGARNSPQLFPVIFNVAAEGTPASAIPSPSGLIFTVQQNSARSNAQAITVFTSSTQPVPYQASSHTYDNSGWLNLEGTGGTASTAASGRVNVTVNPGSLTPGVYRGEVNVYVAAQGSSEVRSVNVTMIVTPAPPAPPTPPPPTQPPPRDPTGKPNGRTEGPLGLENCSPNSLVPTHTGLVNNFQTRTGFPTPLSVRVLDNCGEPVTTAQVLLEFSNADPPLALTNLNNGNYIGTWAPRSAPGGSVSVRGTVTFGQLAARLELLGRVLPSATPILEPNGIFNRFDRRPGTALAPGALVELTGANLAATAASVNPENDRLPDSVNGVTIFAGSARAPISALDPRRLSAQLPTDSSTEQLMPIVVRAGSLLSAPIRVGLIPAQPGVASTADGRVIAFDENVLEINAGNKAKRGTMIYVLVAGMGATSPVVPAGSVSPGDPFAVVNSLPEVTVGGKLAEVRNAGLAPGQVGVYQVELVLAEDTPSGDQPILIRQGGAVSNAAMIPVE